MAEQCTNEDRFNCKYCRKAGVTCDGVPGSVTGTPPTMRTEILGFSEAMAKELIANEGKGDFFEWDPDRRALISEIDHHLNKLKLAMHSGAAPDLVTEYAADLGNFCMKAHLVYGLGGLANAG